MKEGIKRSCRFIKKWTGIISNAILSFIVKYNFIIFLTAFSILAFVLRVKLLKFRSSDFKNFLYPWICKMQGKSYRGAMRTIRGTSDYTTPYVTFLYIVSKFSQAKWLSIVKINSFFFDFVTAVFVGLICRKCLKNNTGFLIGYAITLVFPTVIVNSALWGQCDCIFTAFVVASLYFIMCDKNNLGMLLYGFAISIKLQAIFFAPVIVYLIAKKKLNIFSLLWIFVAIFISVMPALACGISFKNAFFDVYSKQKDEYKALELNAPNLYKLISYTAHYGLYPNEPNYDYKEWVSSAGVLFTVCFIGIMTIIFVRKKFESDPKILSSVFFLYAVSLPFLLPRMHERYWYLADVAGIIYLVLHPKKFYVPLLSQYPSFRVCVGFLFNTKGYGDYWIFYVILMAVGFVLCIASVYQDVLGAQRRFATLQNVNAEPEQVENVEQEEQVINQGETVENN